MTQCAVCNEKIQDGDVFCISCGTPIQTPSTPDKNLAKEENETKSTSSTKKGRLVFPDSSVIEIDSSHRLVGRANLGKYSQKGLDLISRGQFTVYLENEKYYLKDGRTNVQNKPSVTHTVLNEVDITGKEKSLLKDGDEIQISDVKILFKEGD
ncbi:MAG: zinc-ribbon domain-containing protein [Acidimicrobiales bacterium]